MEPSIDDGFKWFGEGFDGFPKSLSDDTVEYSLYVIDEKLKSIAATRARLNDILKEVTAHTSHSLKDYIWQREPFAFQIDKTAEATTPHLSGRTSFGDSIADEWLIVYILVELSKKYKDSWIKVSDDDGEFLLIEAANALPKWLNPEVAANRVWISNGHLRLIPLNEGSSGHNLSIQDALSFIRDRREDLVISPFVEDAALARTKTYPGAIADSLHHAMITVPRRVAYLLHHSPTYISPAVEAFYIRDLVSLKPLQTKDLADLVFPPEDFITTSIKFTKVNYAQLRSQVFSAPPSWTSIAPRAQQEKVQMGMKLACGFEMLLADPANKDKKAVREMQILLADLDSGDAHLPNDKEVESWPTQQDDEKWLDIDYADFDAELAGKAKGKTSGDAQDTVREMVAKFQQFVNDDKADVDAVSDDDDDEASSISSTGEDKDGSFDDAEFEQAMKEMMGMTDADKQDSGLLEEARKLAIADGDNADSDVDEETQEIMRRMEQELKGHGALRQKKTRPVKTVVFGLEPPPDFKRQGEESAEEDIGPGDVELSSDEEDYNDVDVNLARNLLQSFKGQAGASGPAGNMMRALGMNMPRDEDSD